MSGTSERAPTDNAHLAFPRFSGSEVRHGTVSGYGLHRKAGERPCNPCYVAKQTYDRRRLETTVAGQRGRLRARAQARALSALAKRHKDEYDALYRDFIEQIFAPTSAVDA